VCAVLENLGELAIKAVGSVDGAVFGQRIVLHADKGLALVEIDDRVPLATDDKKRKLGKEKEKEREKIGGGAYPLDGVRGFGEEGAGEELATVHARPELVASGAADLNARKTII
jgi:hypothetical protein